MAINFPTSLDVFTDPTSSDQLNLPSHSGLHTDINSAVEALEAKVGVDGSAVATSLEYRIAQLEAAGSPIVKVAAFTSSGTWTVPSGVTYAIAHILGGGGGGGTRDNNGSAGGDSSVAFAGGTVTAGGGAGAPATGSQGASGLASSPANSGIGGISNSGGGGGKNGGLIVAGDTVTPGASITVTVGAGGADGGGPYNPGGDGGSGYVWIEYQES
jgi:hypothetical protein